MENLLRGRKIYEPPRYMSINTAVEQLLLIEERRGEGVCTRNTVAVGVARVGAADQCIRSGTLGDLLNADFGAPLHSLVIAGPMHLLEADFVRRFAVDGDNFTKHAIITNS